MGGSRGAEPFNGMELNRYIEKSHGAKLLRHDGGSHRTYELPSGQRVLSIESPSPISGNVAHDIAKRLGITYAQLRADMGCPLIQSGKSRFKPRREVAAARVGKRQVLDLTDDLRERLLRIDKDLRSGQRDSSVYERAVRHLEAAAGSVASAELAAKGRQA